MAATDSRCRMFRVGRPSCGPALILLVAIIGCSGATGDRPAVAPVRGSVHYNGRPVGGATVTFFSPRSPRTSTGTTNESGEFQLTTFDANDGAVVGENAVSIRMVNGSDMTAVDPMGYVEAMQSGRGLPRHETRNMIPGRYAGFESSRLERTVVGDQVNEFHFELTD